MNKAIVSGFSIRLAATLGFLLFAGRAEPAEAEEPPGKGLYLGAHYGGVLGHSDPAVSGSGARLSSDQLGTLAGGVQVGYGQLLGKHLMLGGEADVSFPNFRGNDDRASSLSTMLGDVEERLDAWSTLRARVGYAFARGLVYGSAGLAGALGHFVLDPGADERKHWRFRLGFTAGAGLEVPLSQDWAARLEYRYDWLGRVSASLGPDAGVSSTLAVHEVQIGLDWRLPWLSGDAPSAEPRPVADDVVAGAGVGAQRSSWSPAWNIHGQTTYVEQGYPSFHSPYQGAQSLSGASQTQHTLSATAFFGLRAWRGGELYFNPELMQGFGLSDVHGVAAFPNGEAQKSSFPVPRSNAARIYLSQSFGLGGEREPVADGPNQLAGWRDVSRITVTMGKLAVTDFFLLNRFAGEPRTGFLNWNVYGGGSYDWTMDLLSWTWGGLVELNRPRWAARAGYFLLPDHASSNYFDTRIPNHGQYVAETDLRVAPWGRPGKVQLFGWLSYGNIGSYAAALAEPTSTPGYPDIALTRGHDRWNGGFVVSLEQSVGDDLGLFSRLSFSPERGESMGWTDCGSSFSLGAALAGTAWRRPQDTLGLAGVIEGLSPVTQRYLAAGGMGTIIGDGRLDYRPETALETYYAYLPWPALAVTLDYQLIVDPGYNADRGPVSIFALRVHADF